MQNYSPPGGAGTSFFSREQNGDSGRIDGVLYRVAFLFVGWGSLAALIRCWLYLRIRSAGGGELS